MSPQPDVRRACRGWPEGHVCPVVLPAGSDRLWCAGCLRSRQKALAAGLPGDLVPVGILLDDFEAPKLQCACGGDPEGPRHNESLLHLKWSFQIREEAR